MKTLSNLFLTISHKEKFHEIGQAQLCQVDLQVSHRTSRATRTVSKLMLSNRLILQKDPSLTLLNTKWETDKISWLLHSLWMHYSLTSVSQLRTLLSSVFESLVRKVTRVLTLQLERLLISRTRWCKLTSIKHIRTTNKALTEGKAKFQLTELRNQVVFELIQIWKKAKFPSEQKVIIIFRWPTIAVTN